MTGKEQGDVMEVGKEKGYKRPYYSLVTLHPRSQVLQQPFCSKYPPYFLQQQNTTDHRAPAPTFILGVSSIDPWLTPVKKREIYDPFQINSIPIQRFKVRT